MLARAACVGSEVRRPSSLATPKHQAQQLCIAGKAALWQRWLGTHTSIWNAGKTLSTTYLILAVWFMVYYLPLQYDSYNM